MTCKNCGHKVVGKFCDQCGQNANVGRINLTSFLNYLSEGVFQIDKGFFYTVRALSKRPGNSLKEFLSGKRKDYFKPIAYVLTLSTLYFLITQLTSQNTWIDDLISGWVEGATAQGKDGQIPIVLAWFSKNYAYAALLLLPVFSWASYLSFSKFGANYLEHIVINSYITGHQAFIYSLFAITGTLIDNTVMEAFPFVLAIAYNFWVFWQFFSNGSRVGNILRSLMTYVLYFVFNTVLLIISMWL